MELNTIHHGNSLDILSQFPDNCVDLIFADPPYNLQLNDELYRPNETKFDGVDDEWDKFSSFEDYDEFCLTWLRECQRVLKKDGTIWVIGSYHNIFRIGKIMQDIGLWILNDVVWVKSNPTPNFLGTRFNNAHETLIWASKSEDSKFTFNYQAMKRFNDDKQMRSDWVIPICQGSERLQKDGKKVHSTQKPEELLYRVILSSSNPGDTVLDPFFGTGTTGAVAKKLQRNYIGIEQNKTYYEAATERLQKTKVDEDYEQMMFTTFSRRSAPKVSFTSLISEGYLSAGQILHSKDEKYHANVKSDGTLTVDGNTGSIHKLSAFLLGKKSNNGWDFWFVETDSGMISINQLRNKYRKEVLGVEVETYIDNKILRKSMKNGPKAPTSKKQDKKVQKGLAEFS